MATAEERLSYLEGAYEHLATKADIARLEGQIESSRAALEGQITSTRAALEGQIASSNATLREHISNSEKSLIKWMVGTGIGVVLGLSAIIGVAIALVEVLTG